MPYWQNFAKSGHTACNLAFTNLASMLDFVFYSCVLQRSEAEIQFIKENPSHQLLPQEASMYKDNFIITCCIWYVHTQIYMATDTWNSMLMYISMATLLQWACGPHRKQIYQNVCPQFFVSAFQQWQGWIQAMKNRCPRMSPPR